MSLNKFTNSDVRKQWMNINANEVKCATFEVDNKEKLQPSMTWAPLEVANLNTLWSTEAGVVEIQTLAGGVDGQVLHIFTGGNGGQITLKNNFATATPEEKAILTSTGADVTLPTAGTIGSARLIYDESLGKWLASA
jgi:hypothetical protein